MKHIEGDLKCKEHRWGGDWHDMFTHLTEIKHEFLKAEYSEDGQQRIVSSDSNNFPMTKNSWRWRQYNGMWMFYRDDKWETRGPIEQ